ncbi:MAG TPA: helix-turn-helix domain-containing protein [Candidatus Binataceae bacterium]|nr:helix-turn-helix domain-containing protein [Candidatus Binataceae bacterium]
MARGGRTAVEVATLSNAAIRLVLAGETPEEAAAYLGISARRVYRALRAWRLERGVSKTELLKRRQRAREEAEIAPPNMSRPQRGKRSEPQRTHASLDL